MVMTGGGGRVWGPPGGMLEGNNELAVALIILMPMLFYLRQTEANVWLRRLLLFSMVTVVFSILGSQSRGALLGLLAMAFFLGLKGKHPVRTSLLLLAFGVLALAFMPETWSGRMDSINTYQKDGSAMSRIWTWTTLWNAAVDRPFVGAGFAADNDAVFSRYAPQDDHYAIFRGRVFVAHSIYFQVLGEHGFVGLALFLLLGLTTWITAGRIARRVRDDAEFGAWMPLLMRMVQVSIVGYGVGGAFLSLAYLDVPYYVMGFVVSAWALVHRRPVLAGVPGTPVVTPGQPAQPAR
jgi:probable O-glycosylation ligase (exosortase A-associated)